MVVFKRTESCKIYFTLSELNSIQDIELNCVQVTIRDIKTNNNILASKYLNNIMLCTLNEE